MSSRQTVVLRQNFSDAFDAYSREGARLRDLLVQLDDSAESQELVGTINRQQDRLDRALRRYNEARQAYLFRVLKAVVYSE